MNPPVAKRVEHRREHHGDVFVDHYEWLRDKSDPEVTAYLTAENEYTDQATAHLAPLRQQIFDEIKARTKETQPTVDGSVVFDIFQKLDGAHDRHDQNFRYILGLLLMRRKRLKFLDVEKTEDGEFLVLEDRRLQDVKYRLLDPRLSEEEMQHAKDQVGKLFSMNVDEDDEEKQEDGQASSESPSEVHQP